MIRKTVNFILPVAFVATDEKQLAAAIKEFLKDPCYKCQCSSGYGWEQKKVKRTPTTRSSHKEEA